MARRSWSARKRCLRNQECGSWFQPYHTRSIMVRMLMADDGRHLLRSVILLRGLAWKIGDPDHPAEAGLGAELPRRHHVVGAVERTGHDLDAVAVGAAKAQRRAAGGAKAALGDGGRAEERRLPLGPGKVRLVHVGKGSERRPAGLLAHPAVADRDPVRSRHDSKAHRATLAAAGENWFAWFGHACSIQRRKRITTGKDEAGDAGCTQRRLGIGGAACQIDKSRAGGL